MATHNRRGAAAVCAVLLAGAMSACSSGGGAQERASSSPVELDQAATVCAADAAEKKVALPRGFPADFPLPAGTTVYGVDDRGADGIVVTGVTGERFHAVLDGLNRDLPAHGFTLQDGETEPHDAESDWSSSDYEGRWAIRELSGCAGDTLVNVVARAAGSSGSDSSD